MLRCMSIDSLMDVNTKLLPDQGGFLKMSGDTEIGGKTELPDGGESIFVRTEDYLLTSRILRYLKLQGEDFSIQIMDTLE